MKEWAWLPNEFRYVIPWVKEYELRYFGTDIHSYIDRLTDSDIQRLNEIRKEWFTKYDEDHHRRLIGLIDAQDPNLDEPDFINGLYYLLDMTS